MTLTGVFSLLLYCHGGLGPGGSGDAYQASFAINPLSGYGVMAMSSGLYSDMLEFVLLAVEAFQPAFDNLKDSISTDLYQGNWTSSDGQTYINISLDDGALWAHQIILEGTDAVTLLLGAVAAGDKVTLWPTFRPGVEEFRFVLYLRIAVVANDVLMMLRVR